MPPALPPDATAALSNLFLSGTEIDTVLLLERDPARAWDETSLARALRLGREHAGALLDGLTRRGFLAADGPRYRYDPATPGMAAAVRQLACLRPGERVAAIGLVFARARGPVADFGLDGSAPS